MDQIPSRRSADFPDIERYPEIRFESKRIEPVGGPRLRVIGDLTIRGTTREVVDYRDVQFTKAEPVLRAIGLAGLEKSESALRERRNKGVTN